MWVDRGLHPERAAEILVTPVDGGPRRRGSGYLVFRGRVLTAAHVVEGAAKVEVRIQAGRSGEETVAGAVEWRHDRIDVAVLVVPFSLGDTQTGLVPVSFGRVGEQDTVQRCTALGFPLFKVRLDMDGSRYRDAEHVDATCAVLSNRREGTLDLKVAAPPADDSDHGRDAWEGMSGAAVFAGGHLVGVVTRHHRTDGPGRIAAIRVDRWAEALSQTELAALEHVLGRRLAPSELPDGGQATLYGAPPQDPVPTARDGGPLGHADGAPAVRGGRCAAGRAAAQGYVRPAARARGAGGPSYRLRHTPRPR
jgi:hypothetical protein